MKRGIFSILLGLSFSVAGVLIAGIQIQEDSPRVVEVWPLALAIGLTIVSWLIQGAIIALLAWPQLKEIQVLDMTRLYLATQAAGAVTPFSGGEVAYQLLELRRRGLPTPLGGALILIRSVFNGVVLFAAAAVGFLLVPNVPFLGKASSLPFSGHNPCGGSGRHGRNGGQSRRRFDGVPKKKVRRRRSALGQVWLATGDLREDL